MVLALGGLLMTKVGLSLAHRFSVATVRD
jgi:hypothetical protein